MNELIVIVQDRPKEFEDKIVWNAPRPLYGDAVWTGDFITGCFYAMTDPGNPINSENEKLNAKIVEFISPQQYRNSVEEYQRSTANFYGVSVEEFPFSDAEWSFQNVSRDNGIRFITEIKVYPPIPRPTGVWG